MRPEDDPGSKKIEDSSPEDRMRYLCERFHKRMQVYLRAGGTVDEDYTDVVQEEFVQDLKALGLAKEQGKFGRGVKRVASASAHI